MNSWLESELNSRFVRTRRRPGLTYLVCEGLACVVLPQIIRIGTIICCRGNRNVIAEYIHIG